MKNITVGLKELRENTETYINQVEKGRSFIVLRRSKPVFKISSPNEDDLWEQVADFTTVNRNGVLATDVLREIHKLDANS